MCLGLGSGWRWLACLWVSEFEREGRLRTGREQRVCCVLVREQARGSVSRVHGYGIGSFVDDVDPCAVWVYGEMTGVRTWGRREVLQRLDGRSIAVVGMRPHGVARVVGRVDEGVVGADIEAVDARRGVVGQVGNDGLQSAIIVHGDGLSRAAGSEDGAEDGVGRVVRSYNVACALA